MIQIPKAAAGYVGANNTAVALGTGDLAASRRVEPDRHRAVGHDRATMVAVSG